ncbi:MAG TPA: hypothetical protein VFD38_07660 [Myxococcaceae bacterium]|nr:hypothetical protein [Myxococcaceae bacterium]
MWRGLFVTLGVCVGCGAGPVSSDSFLTALPSRQTLEVTAPTARAPAALSASAASALGETASLYVLTRQMTAQVNGIVGGPLDTLGDISRTPPAAVGPDSAVWGPFSEPLSPVAARLLVTRVAPGSHRFVLELRPRSGQDSDFEPFLQGASTGAGPGGPSQGTFALDLDLAHRLDPVAARAEGRVVAGWGVAPGGRQVRVALGEVHVGSEPGTTAEIVSTMMADGSGSLVFDAEANLAGGPETIEAGKVGSRWTPAGAGRADVELSGGEAGDGARLTECWDASFARVYAQGASADGGVASEGEPAACAFSEPLR